MKIILEKLNPQYTLSNFPNQQARVSQEPWYLEFVSKNNYFLQTDDFHFILPSKSHLTIDQIIIPPFIQRIDPISRSTKISEIVIPIEIINQFSCGLLSFSNKIKNYPKQFTEKIKTNYYLKLNKSHEELYKNYNKGHKLNLKQASNQNILISESKDISEFANYYKKFSHADIPRNYKKKELISNLVTECMKRNSGFIYKAENQNKEILAFSFLTFYNNRLVYLLSSSSPNGKKQYAMYAIIDHIIRIHSNSELILDFEGSMIPGIAYFMKGFGSEAENYYVYEWNEHWLCKLKKNLKKLF